MDQTGSNSSTVTQDLVEKNDASAPIPMDRHFHTGDTPGASPEHTYLGYNIGRTDGCLCLRIIYL